MTLLYAVTLTFDLEHL